MLRNDGPAPMRIDEWMDSLNCELPVLSSVSVDPAAKWNVPERAVTGCDDLIGRHVDKVLPVRGYVISRPWFCEADGLKQYQLTRTVLVLWGGRTVGFIGDTSARSFLEAADDYLTGERHRCLFVQVKRIISDAGLPGYRFARAPEPTLKQSVVVDGACVPFGIWSGAERLGS